MKKRALLILPILVILFIVLTKYNGAVKSFFLDLINPVKIVYHKFTNISDSYLKQQENILKLEKENAKLKKLLIEDSEYIEQLTKIYKLLPSLAKKPYKSIFLVDTISYTKLNHLNELILTTPKKLKIYKDKLYGLMQDDYVAGVAYSVDNKLYSYLLTHKKCTFSVYVGKDNINGIAQGDGKDGLIVKYIPRWSNIEIGDFVKSSGLDGIFFPNIPVGKVVDVKTLDTYKLAKVKIFANVNKPSMFFLISDASPYLTTEYNPKESFPNKVYPFVPIGNNENNDSEATQTKDKTIEPNQINEKKYLDIFNSNFIINNKMEFNKK